MACQTIRAPALNVLPVIQPVGGRTTGDLLQLIQRVPRVGARAVAGDAAVVVVTEARHQRPGGTAAVAFRFKRRCTVGRRVRITSAQQARRADTTSKPTAHTPSGFAHVFASVFEVGSAPLWPRCRCGNRALLNRGRDGFGQLDEFVFWHRLHALCFGVMSVADDEHLQVGGVGNLFRIVDC